MRRCSISLLVLMGMSAIIGLASCSMKKEKPVNDMASWLEHNMPGQLDVVGNVVDLDPRRLFDKKKATILAAKDDPEVQILVNWQKQEEGLEVSKESIETALTDARRDVSAARAIRTALEAQGMQRFAVGVIEMAAYILTYDEPLPEARAKMTAQVLSAITSMPGHEQTSIFIECMEPSVYQEHFKDIVPYGYWQRGDTYHDQQKIIALNFEWNDAVKTEDLMPHWWVNDRSTRAMNYAKEAYQAVLPWAHKHVSSTIYIEGEQMIMVGVDSSDSLSLHYSFPYFTSMPDTTQVDFDAAALGYVSVRYHPDTRAFSGFERTDPQ